MMPAGKYYVGDLCYCLSNKWDQVCELIIDVNKHEVLEGEFNLPDGTRFASLNTKYGDGTYSGSDGIGYAVDSGGIGCVLVDAVTLPDHDGYAIIEFKEPFKVYEEDGILYFGDLTIDTVGSGEEEYDEDEESWR